MGHGAINQPELYESTDFPESEKDRLRTSPANTPSTPLYVEIAGSGSTSLKCIKDVINLTANVPLPITFSSIGSICSHEFCDSAGNVIYLSTEISGNQITICSKQNLSNILYRIIGE